MITGEWSDVRSKLGTAFVYDFSMPFIMQKSMRSGILRKSVSLFFINMAEPPHDLSSG